MFIDFVDSEWYDGYGHLDDRLLKPQWLQTFRRRWGLDGGRSGAPDERLASHPHFKPGRSALEGEPARTGTRPRGGVLEDLLELRELLRRIVDTVATDKEVAAGDIKRLNGFLEKAAARYRVRKTRSGVSLESVPLVEDDEWLVGAIALSAARFLASGDRRRLKVCSNSGCRWVFYDDTKNRSRRWCDSNLCGNLFKVRRYRSRHR